MPIHQFVNNTVQLEFGFGDIEVCPGLTEHKTDEGKNFGVMNFVRNEYPKTVGIETVYVTPGGMPEAETIVQMVFHKPESIDVLIRNLEKVKRFMKNCSIDHK